MARQIKDSPAAQASYEADFSELEQINPSSESATSAFTKARRTAAEETSQAMKNVWLTNKVRNAL